MHAGERIWVLACDSDEELRSWMKALCKATKRLKLTDKSIGGNVVLSTVNPKAELTSRLSSYNRTEAKRRRKGSKRAAAQARNQVRLDFS